MQGSEYKFKALKPESTCRTGQTSILGEMEVQRSISRDREPMYKSRFGRELSNKTRKNYTATYSVTDN